jgi:NAD(P)-dependent dehydrogenase (short-subunit alcohol dehydrogenase family)
MRTIEEEMKGKVVIITGGTKGIGKGCVDVFCELGANVVIGARSADVGMSIADEKTRKGPGKCMFFKCDVSMHENIKELVEYTAAQFGRINILINNAGYFPEQRPVDDVPVEEFQQILTTNLVAYYAGCKYVLPHLRKTKGSIVNVGSVLGLTGDEGSAIYSATKGAISTMTKSLAIDEARNGVRINEIKPGNIYTEMFEKTARMQEDPGAFRAYSDTLQWIGRGGMAAEIGRCVVFLASEWASFVTGASLLATGGYEIGEGPKKPLWNWTSMEKR